MSALNKAALLLGVGLRDPAEFLDRIEAIVTVKFESLTIQPPAYQLQSFDEVRAKLQELLGPGFIMEEPELDALEAQVKARAQKLSGAPFMLAHNADFTLARLCYGMCRALKPQVVLETGVAYGVTTSFLLKALAANGSGVLHSIDLPPLGKDADSFVGTLVPEELKSNWTLHRGTSKRIMPDLLAKLGKVDMFIHDSLHTYGNIKRELDLVTPRLARPGLILSDDIKENPAFLEWAGQTRPAYWSAVREQDKDSVFGVAIFSK